MVVAWSTRQASASDIVAARWQDHKRACCSARRRSARDRYKRSCLWKTTRRFALTTGSATSTPNGRSIQATGITPDIVRKRCRRRPQADGVPRSPCCGRRTCRAISSNRRSPAAHPATTPAAEEPEEAPLVREGEVGKDPATRPRSGLLKSWNVFKAVVAQQAP